MGREVSEKEEVADTYFPVLCVRGEALVGVQCEHGYSDRCLTLDRL